MKVKRSISISLVVALLAAVTLSAVLPQAAMAALPAEGLYAGAQQPPPPSVPGGNPATPQQPDTQQQNAPLPEAPGQQPAVPSTAPNAAKALPNPNSQMAAPAGAEASTFAISTDQLEVVANRGCPSQYQLNDPIEFIGRRGVSTYPEYWLYMEIWNSTNNAWWTKLAADWVAPGGSITRTGRIAEPVGQEQLYSRLIDQYGNVVHEAWCEYSTSAGPAYPSIQCNQTVNRSVAINEENKFLFYGVGGRRVQINMTGPNGLDTYLELIAPNGSVVAQNDDINVPWDLNSRIQTVLPTTGTYTILARGFKRQAGQYTLTVTCN